MKYIIYESAITSLSESVQSNGEVVEFVTTLQEADVKNRNGRIYPKQVIEEGLKGPMVQEKLRRHSLFGEVGHPYSQDVARQTQVDINNCAFRINEMWWEGNLLKGKCETLDTAKGRDMAGLIKQGCELSFSMRGQGNVARDPYRDALVVKSPLMIITYDWVYLPSHQTAYMDSFTEETRESMTNAKAYSNMSMALNESANLYENGSLVEINEETKEKPMKDYYSNYRRSIKTLNETYIYDANDTVKEINDKYVILENADCLKKVAKEDYLLKSIRSDMTNTKELLNEGFLSNFFKNTHKFKKEDITVTKLVDTYLKKNPSILHKTKFIESEIRSMSRNDSVCSDIIDNLEAEISDPKQNKARINNLLSRFEARLDNIVANILHQNKDMRYFKEDNELEYSGDIINESFTEKDEKKWKFAKKCIKFLPEDKMDKFLVDFFNDESMKTKSKDYKVQKIHDIMNRISPEIKEKILHDKKLCDATKEIPIEALTAASGGVAGAGAVTGAALTAVGAKPTYRYSYYHGYSYEPNSIPMMNGGIAAICISVALAIIGIITAAIINKNNTQKNSKVRDEGTSSALNSDKENIKSKLKTLDNIEHDKKLRESVCDIAPLDIMYSTESLTDEKAKCKKCDTDKLETTQEIGKDVKPVIVEDNVLEASTEPATPVDKELDEKGLKSDGVAIPTTEVKKDEEADEIDPVKKEPELSIVDKVSLKEEFTNMYNLISTETGLTNEKDILSRGLNYSEYMSEECAELFKYLLYKGE